MKILVLNLGSTSTKAGVFEDTLLLRGQTIRHDKAELAEYGGILGQKEYRKTKLKEWLDGQGFRLGDMAVIAARGGLIRPVEGGIFRIDAAAAADAAGGKYGMHPANVGMLIAHEWGLEHGIPAVFLDAPATDELSALARVSGFNGVTRRSIFHALNAKRVVRLYCLEHGLDPLQGRFIVAHMGGGTTVSAIDGLRAVDLNSGVDGEGPFTPERAGSLPAQAVLKLVREYGGDTALLQEDLYRKGGLQSYFGTNNVTALLKRAEKEPEVSLVLDAMIYNVAKCIGAMAAALSGRVDRILLTGGIAYNPGQMDSLIARVNWITGCTVYPGEDELAALAEGAFRYLTGAEEAKSIDG